MANPNTSGIPGMGAMNDTFDFMKNLWSGMGMPGLQGMKIPGMVMPTLSVDEINKQIKDLKSVEAWLTMNLSMLRSTIQALEVQSATITAIQSMGASLAEAIKPSAKPEQPAQKDKSGKPAFESPFASASEKAEETPAEAAEKTEAAAPETAKDSNASASAEGAAPLIPPMANPAAWWGVLQDQFKQAVDTAAAMTPEMTTAAAKLAEGAQSPKPAKPKETKAAKSAASQTTAKQPVKGKKK